MRSFLFFFETNKIEYFINDLDARI
jgi:hypothetical protein